ncbi:MAG: response regulator [Polyangiales bacterium]
MNAPATVKILLVDDLDDNLFVLATALRREGLEMLMARSAREALELLLAHDVALAIVDVHMPDIDGFELAELMRGSDRTRHVPIIFVTAGVNDRRREFRGYEVGAVDFLFKPFDVVLLRHKVTTFVELYRQRLELREMLHLNEMFVAAISHDLRQPLSTVVMVASTLHRQLEGTKRQAAVDRIRSSAQRMTGMLDQLYDLARARLAGGISLERQEIPLGPLLARVVREAGLTVPARAVRLQCADDCGFGTWDEQRLAQVFANLVGNALRHGTPEVEVTVRARGTPSTVVVEVHNGGVVADDLIAHIFEPFHGRTRTSRDSLGLGLYIVKQIVLAHAGTVDVASSVETGVTFRVELPRSSPGTSDEPVARAEERAM